MAAPPWFDARLQPGEAQSFKLLTLSIPENGRQNRWVPIVTTTAMQ
jgi:hypothetical protein